MERRVPVGLSSLHYANIIKDDDTGYQTDTPKVLALGAVDISGEGNAEDNDFYAEDMLYAKLGSTTSSTQALQCVGMPPEVEAEITGAYLDANGAVIHTDADKPIDIAVGYRARYSDGSYEYVWMYKCRATMGSKTRHTVEATATGQVTNINLSNIPTVFKGNKGKSLIDITLYPGTNVSDAVIEKWFEKVQLPATVKTPVDKAALTAAINEADALSLTGYTTISWNDVQTALIAAKAVKADPTATQIMVNTASINLRNAIDALEVDKTDLASQIAAADSLNESDYTASSWSAMQVALAAAKTIYADPDATPSQVQTAASDLQTAISGLVPTP